VRSYEIIDKIWLLSGLIDSAPGVLEVREGVFRVTLIDCGTLSKKRLDEFGRKYDIENLSLRLEEGPVEFFKTDFKSEDKLKFPWYYFGGGAVAHIGKKKLKLSFAQPQNTRFPVHKLSHSHLKVASLGETAGELKHAISLGKELKKLTAA